MVNGRRVGRFLQVCSGLRICEVKVRNNRAGEAQPGGPSSFLWGVLPESLPIPQPLR